MSPVLFGNGYLQVSGGVLAVDYYLGLPVAFSSELSGQLTGLSCIPFLKLLSGLGHRASVTRIDTYLVALGASPWGCVVCVVKG